MTTSREEFEAWFKREIIESPDFVFNEFDEHDNEYTVGEDGSEELYINIQAMFMAWQASRAALVVELPQKCMCGNNVCKAGNFQISKCEKAMRAAGITVKGDR